MAIEQQPAQQLKLVTILFLDVVGSTTLSQRLDPEEIHAVMDGALASYSAIVEAHHGKVLQYAGDNLLAAFGADEVREDDPERAVRAGLAMLEEGRLQGERIRHEHGHVGFDVRVGLHTGAVLLGGGVNAEGSIRGIAVNVAARLEQSAPAGALLISHDTYRHVRDVFEVEVQPPLDVKGLDTPMVTYLVKRAKVRAFRVATRGVEGVETRMVGRDAELGVLQDAFERLLLGRRLGTITVVGEAGLGKSRLLDEFKSWTETQPGTFIAFQGSATPQTRNQPFGLLRDILAWRFGIVESDSMQAAKDKIERGIAPLFRHASDAGAGIESDPAHAHILGHLVGLDFSASPHVKGIVDDAEQIRNRGFHAAAQLFRRVGGQDDSPVVLQIEDLHWSDDGTLDFLNYLIDVNRDVPMLIVGLTRPTLFERRSDWDRTGSSHRRIDLGLLGETSSRELANELLKKLPDIPDALRELITGSAEGNPFYMEELVKMFVDQGALETGPERWTLHPEKLLATNVPQTLTGVLQARLDSLSAPEKLALQQASVIGLVFWDGALAAIDAGASVALPALVRRDLIVPHKMTRIEGVPGYSFKHQILHRVTYETLLKRNRSKWHASAATWLAGLTGANAGEFLGVTAEHYKRAGEHDKACEYFARAAEQAKARYAHEAALAHVDSALALLGEGEDLDKLALRWRLLSVREDALDLSGRRSEQLAALDALQHVADAMADDQKRAELALARSHAAARVGDYPLQASMARLAMEVALHSRNHELRIRAQRMLASALASDGDTTSGLALALDGLAQAKAGGLRRAESHFVNVLANIHAMQDNYQDALEQSQRELVLARELGDRVTESVALTNLGGASLQLGDLVPSRLYLEEALNLCRDIGNRVTEAHALANLSRLALWEGDDATALEHGKAALVIAVASMAVDAQALAHCCLGNAELALGHHAAAALAFECAETVAQGIGHGLRYDAAAGRARVALAQGDMGRAMQQVESLWPQLAAGGHFEGAEWPRSIQLTSYQVLERSSDPRAREVLATAYEWIQSRAAGLRNPARHQAYLHNIPEHRKIVSAWLAHQANGSPAGGGG